METKGLDERTPCMKHQQSIVYYIIFTIFRISEQFPPSKIFNYELKKQEEDEFLKPGHGSLSSGFTS